jgi:hypothetical protein
VSAALVPAGGDGPAPIVPLDGGPPRHAPIEGGGRCDRCGWRTFRRTPAGPWRHEPCEPKGYHVGRANVVARRLAAMWSASR